MTLRAALNIAQTESPKITQSKCWIYFKTTTQAGAQCLLGEHRPLTFNNSLLYFNANDNFIASYFHQCLLGEHRPLTLDNPLLYFSAKDDFIAAYFHPG